MRPVYAACALGALFLTAAFAQPQIFFTPNGSAKAQNNYSNILPGMPSYGIAQGSIFDLYGLNLATTTSPLQSVPLPISLSGTSVDVSVNGTTTHAILYYISPGQIAAILPSATPAGTGQITVTVNGKTSSPAPITVVQSAFGLLTLNGAGLGPAAAFDTSSHYLGLTNSANPGEFITLWGSGLGPTTADETVAQTPANIANITPEVDIGGKPATVQYAGRSVYPGLDQINAQVPSGVTGCRVSVVIRIGNTVSNFGTIPVAASGRTCSDPIAGLTAAQIQNLLSKSVINRGALDSVAANADALFEQYTNAQYAIKQPIGAVTLGDCMVFNYRNVAMGLGNPIQGMPLDAGPSIKLSTPNGNVSIPFQDGGYSVSNLPTGSARGTYTFTGSGGPDVGSFSTSITFPGGGSGFAPTFPSNAQRYQGLTVSWNPPDNLDPNEFVQISGFSFVPYGTIGAEFVCNAPLTPPRFTIPPTVLLALPSQTGLTTPQATLEVDLAIVKQFTAPGIDIGIFTWLLGNGQIYAYQ
jgi:uncharacterized protein (TIGR03437 family)